eukprot:758909-Hanusia_phi.AAC.1
MTRCDAVTKTLPGGPDTRLRVESVPAGRGQTMPRGSERRRKGGRGWMDGWMDREDRERKGRGRGQEKGGRAGEEAEAKAEAGVGGRQKAVPHGNISAVQTGSGPSPQVLHRVQQEARGGGSEFVLRFWVVATIGCSLVVLICSSLAFMAGKAVGQRTLMAEQQAAFAHIEKQMKGNGDDGDGYDGEIC